MPRKPKQAPHLRIRVPPRLLARLQKAREKNGRTLTGEIVFRLDQSFQGQELSEAEAAGMAAGAADAAAWVAAEINEKLNKVLALLEGRDSGEKK